MNAERESVGIFWSVLLEPALLVRSEEHLQSCQDFMLYWSDQTQKECNAHPAGKAEGEHSPLQKYYCHLPLRLFFQTLIGRESSNTFRNKNKCITLKGSEGFCERKKTLCCFLFVSHILGVVPAHLVVLFLWKKSLSEFILD